MRISIVSIGSELLIGHTVNTNLAFIGESLAREGYTVDREVCIPDVPDIIEKTFQEQLSLADLVISIGGLGPTRDDMTRVIGAKVTGAELRHRPEVLEHIKTYLGPRLSLVPEEALLTQSMVPENAEPLLNHNGTAPGLWCPRDERTLLLLPGPPRELRPMFTQKALPLIRQHGEPDSCRRSLTVYGIPEATVADRLESSVSFPENVEVAYCTRAGEVDIRLTAPPDMAVELEQLIEKIRELFGQAAVVDSVSLSEAVGKLLKEQNLHLALAESCTGGLIASAVVEPPGASAYFQGSIVCYSNDTKTKLLRVPEKEIDQFGAVSEPVARSMAAGALKTMNAETAIAITGIAGPAGGSKEKPVGLVFIATAVQEEIKVNQYNFSGNRERIRNRAVTTALNDLRLHLLKHRSEIT